MYSSDPHTAGINSWCARESIGLYKLRLSWMTSSSMWKIKSLSVLEDRCFVNDKPVQTVD